MLPEKVLRIISFSLRRMGKRIQIKGSHRKHFTRTLAVTACNERRVDIKEIALLKKAMNRIRSRRTNSEYCAEQIGAGTQVRHCPKVLSGMTFFLQRIVRRRSALCLDGGSVNFKRLFRLRRYHDDPLDGNGGADV